MKRKFFEDKVRIIKRKGSRTARSFSAAEARERLASVSLTLTEFLPAGGRRVTAAARARPERSALAPEMSTAVIAFAPARPSHGNRYIMPRPAACAQFECAGGVRPSPVAYLSCRYRNVSLERLDFVVARPPLHAPLNVARS
ncbi:hypothetical protein EVAR_31210_1 [Eumeta japonica]|uniref:Uncharacterized protein n=1 Tax=Eumeta variegata TaxID=151549 RepID=A0A4C1VVR2_EUMVA|nr:hypothetical protein EVAR_31210_1 [Eumeta japonica]